MYDNLTADDIIDVWSRVQLDRAIQVATYSNRRTYELPPPPPFFLAMHLALQMENERKRPFRHLLGGA